MGSYLVEKYAQNVLKCTESLPLHIFEKLGFDRQQIGLAKPTDSCPFSL